MPAFTIYILKIFCNFCFENVWCCPSSLVVNDSEEGNQESILRRKSLSGARKIPSLFTKFLTTKDNFTLVDIIFMSKPLHNWTRITLNANFYFNVHKYFSNIFYVWFTTTNLLCELWWPSPGCVSLLGKFPAQSGKGSWTSAWPTQGSRPSHH